MIMAQTLRNGSLSYITGVDRLFVAPELRFNNLSEKSDVWSIGTILYLLVTGGVDNKRHEEYFDFQEEIWFNVSEEMLDFLRMMLTVHPDQRATIRELQAHDFIQL